MKKIGCLIFFAGIILAINSCNESRIHDEELLKSSAGYDEIIAQAKTWYNDTPEENCYPLLEFSDGLEWNKALVHELDTATIVEVPIKIKNKHEIKIKDESNLNVDYRLLVVMKKGETTSLCEFIISDIEKEKIKNIKKINYTSTDFNGSILLVNNIGDIVTIKHFNEAEEQSAEMKLKSVQVRCVVLVAIHPDGTTQIVGVFYCYQIEISDGGASTTDAPDIDPEDCDCEICSVCGGCIGSLKSIPIPPEDGGEPTDETTTDCPMCSCPQTKELIARGQIDYLKQRGESELAKVFEEILSDETLPMEDVYKIYDSIEDAYLKLKTEYLGAIFSVDNVASILGLLYMGDISSVTKTKALIAFANWESRMVNPLSTAILRNGYYEVNGFKFTEYYYNKLWNTGRGGSTFVARNILDSGITGIPDSQLTGFYRYVYDGWEMVYNPITKEIHHIQPVY